MELCLFLGTRYLAHLHLLQTRHRLQMTSPR